VVLLEAVCARNCAFLNLSCGRRRKVRIERTEMNLNRESSHNGARDQISRGNYYDIVAVVITTKFREKQTPYQ